MRSWRCVRVPCLACTGKLRQAPDAAKASVDAAAPRMAWHVACVALGREGPQAEPEVTDSDPHQREKVGRTHRHGDTRTEREGRNIGGGRSLSGTGDSKTAQGQLAVRKQYGPPAPRGSPEQPRSRANPPQVGGARL